MNGIPSRPHVQGTARSLPLLSSHRPVTGPAGLLALRLLWDRLRIGAWLDRRCSDVAGWFRPSLMVEMWVALLLYGGWMSDLTWFGRRSVRRLFGWAAVPVPSPFGRWLRRAGEPVAEVVEELIRRIVRLRWERRGVPDSATLVLDSTVILRYGTRQAGGGMDLETVKVVQSAHLLTNLPGIHSLTVWRRYNQGAVVEQRIEELKQLSAGETAVDDLGGNHLLWALSGLTYQLFHTLRRQLPTPWQRFQPKRLRTWLFHTSARLTRRSRQWRVHLSEAELREGLLPRALEAIAASGLRGPAARAA